MWRVVNTAPAKPGVSGKKHEVPHTTYPTVHLYSEFVVSCLSSSLEAVFLLRDVKLEGIWKEAIWFYSGAKPVFDWRLWRPRKSQLGQDGSNRVPAECNSKSLLSARMWTV